MKNLLNNYSAVILLGPRQVGKTTLAKTLSDAYYDLELDEEKLRIDLKWNEIIAGRQLVILDEAQYYPEIFPRLRGAIDQQREYNGCFLILGSVSPGMMKGVSESLTGRTALCELTTMSFIELPEVSEYDLWLCGGFPDGGILNNKNYPDWQKNYIDLLDFVDCIPRRSIVFRI